jgi:hypothetical protein
MSINYYGAVYAETATKKIQNCFCVFPLCWIYCVKVDKALVGNFGRELGGGCYNSWTHCYYHSASAVLQMLAGTGGYILRADLILAILI